jgi:hypothetical protein
LIERSTRSWGNGVFVYRIACLWRDQMRAMATTLEMGFRNDTSPSSSAPTRSMLRFRWAFAKLRVAT